MPKPALKSQVGGEHYQNLAIQPVEYCQRNRLGFCESNVVKYVTRYRNKGGREDLEKAIHYLRQLIEIEYGKESVPKWRRAVEAWVGKA